MLIEKINESNIDEVKDFLKRIPSLRDVEDNILLEGILLRDEKIEGTISFEMIGNYALIRYFVYRKEIDKEYIINLLNSLLKNIKTKVCAIITKEELMSIFLECGFKSVKNEYVFINEDYIFKSMKETTFFLVHGKTMINA